MTFGNQPPRYGQTSSVGNEDFKQRFPRGLANNFWRKYLRSMQSKTYNRFSELSSLVVTLHVSLP